MSAPAPAVNRSAAAEAGVDLDLAFSLATFDVEFRLQTEARCVGIFGPSGAGKTSVLEAVLGWRPVTRGRVRLGGRTLLDSSAGIRVPMEARGIGYVPQDALLFPHKKVGANLTRLRRRSGPARVDPQRAIDVLEIGPLLERGVGRLSGGERQRVALARALCSQPDYLVLDEPFGSLDWALRRRILPYLIRVREEFDLPTLFVSHDAAEVQALCDEVAVLEKGRVVASGPPAVALRTAARIGAAYTNVLRGEVQSIGSGTALVVVDTSLQVHVPSVGLRPGDRVVFSVGADEVLIARGPIAGISARNVIPGRITALAEAEGEIRIDAAVGSAATISALLTVAAAKELALAPEVQVHLVFKTQSCRVLSR